MDSYELGQNTNKLFSLSPPLLTLSFRCAAADCWPLLRRGVHRFQQDAAHTSTKWALRGVAVINKTLHVSNTISPAFKVGAI